KATPRPPAPGGARAWRQPSLPAALRRGGPGAGEGLGLDQTSGGRSTNATPAGHQDDHERGRRDRAVGRPHGHARDEGGTPAEQGGKLEQQVGSEMATDETHGRPL